VDRVAVLAIEAKPAGTILVDVEGETDWYLRGIPDNIPHIQNPLPFEYESTGTETYLADLIDPDWRSRRVFAFLRPKTLNARISNDVTLRGKLRLQPHLQRVWTVAVPIRGHNKPGTIPCHGDRKRKIHAAVNFVYRLIKFANARRILFLVDRTEFML
jgi:type I restriction enzyme, R subunit